MKQKAKPAKERLCTPTNQGVHHRVVPSDDGATPLAGPVVFNAMVLRKPFTGVENAVSAQAAALLTRGDAPSLRVLWPRALAGEAPSLDGRVQFCGPRWSSRALRMLWEQCILPHKLRRMGAALLHAPAYLSPLAAPCKVVLSVYDLHALDQPAKCRPLNRWNYRMFLPSSIRRAWRIIAPSEFTARAIARRFPEKEEALRVIPLGVGEHYHVGTEALTGEINGRAMPSRYLLCVGNIEPRKNLALAVEILALLRRTGWNDLELVVAGGTTMGDPGFEAALLHHGLTACAHRLGYVDLELLPGLYAGAEALLYPAIEEGFGLPPLEAMATGCPVVCADSAALRQTTGEAALLFDAGAPDAAACAAAQVRSILENAEVRANLRRRGLAHIDHYRWPTLVEQITKVWWENN